MVTKVWFAIRSRASSGKRIKALNGFNKVERVSYMQYFSVPKEVPLRRFYCLFGQYFRPEGLLSAKMYQTGTLVPK
jgi:hypothetical protein